MFGTIVLAAVRRFSRAVTAVPSLATTSSLAAIRALTSVAMIAVAASVSLAALITMIAWFGAAGFAAHLGVPLGHGRFAG